MSLRHEQALKELLDTYSESSCVSVSSSKDVAETMPVSLPSLLLTKGKSTSYEITKPFINRSKCKDTEAERGKPTSSKEVRKLQTVESQLGYLVRNAQRKSQSHQRELDFLRDLSDTPLSHGSPSSSCSNPDGTKSAKDGYSEDNLKHSKNKSSLQVETKITKTQTWIAKPKTSEPSQKWIPKRL